MNEHNLIPNSKRSPDEVRANGAKGGKKSGESRRRKKSIKQYLKLLLAMDVVGEDDKAELRLLGIDPDDVDNSMIIVKALFLRAASGDVPAIKEIRNILGEDNSAAELTLKKRELALRERMKEPENEAIGRLDAILEETRKNAGTESETE